MSRLVLPADERSGYLVTQVIADYLANVEKLDGILYRSVQSNTPAANVVLFHHAAAVEPLPLPEGTEVDASLFWSTEDGDEIDYTVWEKVPDAPIAKPARDGFSHLTPGPFVRGVGIAAPRSDAETRSGYGDGPSCCRRHLRHAHASREPASHH
jgi:hypothetical protein